MEGSSHISDTEEVLALAPHIQAVAWKACLQGGSTACSRAGLSTEGAAVLAAAFLVFALGGMVLTWVLFCFAFFLVFAVFN